ncbi:MAG: NTP transferase domain-containing protein [Candidatus Marinimicrobia bacterium]|nr:NTP transferase domain-containing protein [Candidatus Neomarinimicrobiota bacterium]
MNDKLATIILAGGKGTRMKSDLPKVLHRVLGETMVSRVVAQAKSIGAKKIVVVVGYKKELVQDELKNKSVEFAIQEEQLGTGHAIQMAEGNFTNWDGDILILSGDVPLLTTETIEKLIQKHKDEDADGTVLSAIFENPAGYGRIIRKEDGTYSHSVEEKDASNEEKKIKEINSGIYIFKSKHLFNYLSNIGNDNAQGEYYLTDIVPMMVKDNKKVVLTVANDPNEIEGVNTIEHLQNAENKLRRIK